MLKPELVRYMSRLNGAYVLCECVQQLLATVAVSVSNKWFCCWWQERTRSLNVTSKTTEQHLIVLCDKSVAYVTNNKRFYSRFVLLKLTTDRHEALCGLSATAELLVASDDSYVSEIYIIMLNTVGVVISILDQYYCRHFGELGGSPHISPQKGTGNKCHIVLRHCFFLSQAGLTDRSIITAYLKRCIWGTQSASQSAYTTSYV